ncbi:MAG: CPBP family intramembrane metalloprotease [Chloroflexi bacterium]|nr:CPBP family intramembrane metalloprotease [Chloroflexota bacterium]
MWRRTLAFLIPTFVITFLFGFAIYAFLGAALGPLATFALVGYMYIPALVVVVLKKGVYHEPLRELGVYFRPNTWWLVAWLLPPVLALVAMRVGLLFPGVSFSWGMEGMYQRFGGTLTPEQIELMRAQTAALPIHPFWLALLQGLVAGPTINAIAAFGEELGWRGFLLRQLLPLGFWRSAAITGVIWGLWHAPLVWNGYNYPQHPGAIAVAMMTVWTMLLSPVFAWVRLRSGSVIAAAILHGTLNATAGLAIMTLVGGDDLITGLTGLAGFIVLAVANLVILALDRPFLQCQGTDAQQSEAQASAA